MTAAVPTNSCADAASSPAAAACDNDSEDATTSSDKEYTTILVDSSERMLLNKLGETGEYVQLPVSLLQEMDDGTSKQIGEQTIVFIQMPHSQQEHGRDADQEEEMSELHGQQH